MATLPTFYIEDATVTTRAAELPNASFDNGMNFGGSNAPAIGVNVGVADLAGTTGQFTLLDQREAARTPQTSQHIGGNGLGDGVTGILPEGAVRTAINDASGDGSIGATQENVGLAVLATGWEAPVVI
jgi:hypothetical protein